jgi:hypothetical protein
MLPGTQEVEAGGPRTDTRLGKSVKLLEKNTLKLKKKKKKKKNCSYTVAEPSS